MQVFLMLFTHSLPWLSCCRSLLLLEIQYLCRTYWQTQKITLLLRLAIKILLYLLTTHIGAICLSVNIILSVYCISYIQGCSVAVYSISSFQGSSVARRSQRDRVSIYSIFSPVSFRKWNHYATQPSNWSHSPQTKYRYKTVAAKSLTLGIHQEGYRCS